MAKQTKIRVCQNCNNPLPEKATVCSSWGAKNKNPIYKKWWLWLIIALIVIGTASCGVIDPNPSDNQPSSVSSGIEDDANFGDVSSGEMENVSSDEPSEIDSIPKEYKSALKKAESYSDIMNMSKAAIYAQLVSEYGEQFSEEAAQYAIDNLVANWNANALAKAEDYANTMQMSKDRIYDQLISEYGEKFTPEEAQYAVDNVEADWNANALAKAEDYANTMQMSKDRIYDQLISEYGEKFTPEEAQYAVDNVEADWKANALATAESYQELMNMSPSAIYDQLVSEYGEKFTAEEAQYAIDNLS